MKYKRIDTKDLEYLKNLINDDQRVIYGTDIKEEYSHDELGDTANYPDVVVRALSTQEVSQVMKYASQNNIPVTPRGSGTGLVGASVAIEHGIMLDLSLMKRFLELDEENLTLTLEPGVLLMEVLAYAEEHGYMYPPDPGEKSATIGGNISTNAGGMRAVKYGVTRDYIRGLEVVLPNGDIVNLGGKTVKNSSGYDLKDLIIGSEGTLGIVTKAILKLIPLPKVVISLLVPFPTLQQAIRTVPLLVKSKVTPASIEFMEREVIKDSEIYLGKKFPDSQSDAYLLLKFDGNSVEEVEKSYEEAAQICLKSHAIDILISDTVEREESIWKARGAFLEAIKGSTTEMEEADVVVPRNKVNELVEYTHALQKEIGIRIKSFGHAGDGNLHAYILRDDLSESEWKEKLDLVFDKIYAKGRELNGQVSGEHGIGFAKKTYLKQQLAPVVLEIMRGIKRTFDPENILNPHKIF